MSVLQLKISSQTVIKCTDAWFLSMPIWAIDEPAPSKCPKWPLSPEVPHVCVRRAGDGATDGVRTSAECKWTSGLRGRALDDAASLGGPFPTSSGCWRYGGERGREVKEGQTSSACWLRRLGFKVGQLMPGSGSAKWTSLYAMWGAVLEKPPGGWRGCQGDVKHSRCSLVLFTAQKAS